MLFTNVPNISDKFQFTTESVTCVKQMLFLFLPYSIEFNFVDATVILLTTIMYLTRIMQCII
jgi:hypothetical protein